MQMLSLVAAVLALASAFFLYGINYETRQLEARSTRRSASPRRRARTSPFSRPSARIWRVLSASSRLPVRTVLARFARARWPATGTWTA